MPVDLSRIKAFFRNNWHLKLLALLLAALSFLLILGATGLEASYDIPVQVQVEKGIAILEQEPRQVRVTFRGSQEDLRRLDQSRIRAVINPKATDPAGSEQVLITPRHIEGISGVRAVLIRPSVVSVTFDREVEKRFPVARPKIIGTPLAGQAIIDYEPSFVTVRGPDRRLKTKELFTEPVDVDGRVVSFTKQVRVLSGDTWISQIDPAEVTVYVDIVTESSAREWKNVPVRIFAGSGARKNVTLVPDTVNVSLHGRADILNSISNDAIRAFVDSEDPKAAETNDWFVHVHVPGRMDVNITVDPDRVHIIPKDQP